jgi:putative transposase
MSVARPVFPGRFYMVTRGCTQQQFLLRPDDETNNAFIYCLAESAERFGMVVLLPQMMSNHHHTVVQDPHGRINEFTEHFHKMLAKCQNALRGRSENMWASEPPCVVELVDPSAVIAKLVYTGTNPVKDGLVDKVHHWPGPKTLNALLNGVVLRAHRPRHFFRKDGPMPQTVELTLRIPSELGDPVAILAQVRELVTAVEAAYARQRFESGKRVLGRSRVLRQSWRDCPTSRLARGTLRPRVATRNKWARIEALQRNREFAVAYRRARAAWILGIPTVFPAGTYWLRRFANVPVAPLAS